MKTILMTVLAITALQVKAQTTTTPAPVDSVKKEISLTTISVNEEGEHLLADSKGNTLYVFDLDQNRATPACNSACAEVWPPYLLTSDEALNLKAPLGSIVRDNKKSQLTYEGRPVYAYALDRGAAADAGDNIGNVWHYIKIEETPTPAVK